MKQAGRGLSVNTEAAYRGDLARVGPGLAAWHQLHLDDGVDPLTVLTPAHLTLAAVRDVLAGLHRSGAAAATRARTTGTLANLCRWLLTENALAEDPTLGLEPAKRGTRHPVALDDAELATLVATVTTPDPGGRRVWPVRDLALLAVLTGAGVRAGELVALRVRDLQDTADPPVLQIRHGKGDKDRTIPLPQEVVTVAREYLADRERSFDGPVRKDSALFVTAAGNPFTRQALAHHVDRWFTRAAVPRTPGQSVHRLRHTYAVGLVRNGTPINIVQALLGHDHLAATEIYLRTTATDLAHHTGAAPIRSALRRA